MICPNCQKLEKEIKEANIRTARLMTHLKAGDEGYAIQEAQLEALKLQAEALSKALKSWAECYCEVKRTCEACNTLSSWEKFKEARGK